MGQDTHQARGGLPGLCSQFGFLNLAHVFNGIPQLVGIVDIFGSDMGDAFSVKLIKIKHPVKSDIHEDDQFMGGRENHPALFSQQSFVGCGMGTTAFVIRRGFPTRFSIMPLFFCQQRHSAGTHIAHTKHPQVYMVSHLLFSFLKIGNE